MGQKKQPLAVEADSIESLVALADAAAAKAAATEAEWTVTVADGVGEVIHSGHPRFTCKFVKTTQFEFDEASQEIVVNDPVNGRVFYDFVWRRFEEPVGQLLTELTTSLMKKVQLRVGRR